MTKENKKIRIYFIDFWGDFNKKDNFIVNAISDEYEVILDSENPEFLFVGTFGCQHLNYKCSKILFTGENIVPDFNLFDYAIGFDFIDFGDRYFRLPLFCTQWNFEKIRNPQPIDEEKALNRGFCTMVVSNMQHSSPMRKLFFDRLSEYKKVDSGGRMWNNIGGPVADKNAFLKGYKFNIAFENSKYDGYTTEKITDAFAADTIPAYWGNRRVAEDFNAKAFVNVENEKDIDRAVERIVYLDTHPEEYMKILNAPKLVNDSLRNWESGLSTFLKNIIAKDPAEARYTSDFGAQKLHRQHIMMMDKVCREWKGDKMMSLIEKIKLRLGK